MTVAELVERLMQLDRPDAEVRITDAPGSVILVSSVYFETPYDPYIWINCIACEGEEEEELPTDEIEGEVNYEQISAR